MMPKFQIKSENVVGKTTRKILFEVLQTFHHCNTGRHLKTETHVLSRTEEKRHIILTGMQLEDNDILFNALCFARGKAHKKRFTELQDCHCQMQEMRKMICTKSSCFYFFCQVLLKTSFSHYQKHLSIFAYMILRIIISSFFKKWNVLASIFRDYFKYVNTLGLNTL